MKKDKHPEFHPVCFKDVSTGRQFITKSTMRSKNKEKITVDGKTEDCYVVLCEVTSDSHPAYTGEKRFVDSAGRVDKFNTKFARKMR